MKIKTDPILCQDLVDRRKALRLEQRRMKAFREQSQKWDFLMILAETFGFRPVTAVVRAGMKRKMQRILAEAGVE
ncbi:MAG: hypothetical protein ACYDD4_05030 [Acidimicrobiales bacterium]